MRPICFLSGPTKKFSFQNKEKIKKKNQTLFLDKNARVHGLVHDSTLLFLFSFPFFPSLTWPFFFSFFLFSFDDQAGFVLHVQIFFYFLFHYIFFCFLLFLFFYFFCLDVIFFSKHDFFFIINLGDRFFLLFITFFNFN